MSEHHAAGTLGSKGDVRVIEGSADASGLRVALIVSRFNSLVTEPLLDGALDALRRAGADSNHLAVFRTPGAYELPMVASKVAKTGKWDAIVALGCLIRGETLHYDLIASEAAKGLASVGRESGLPVIFGVLTTDTLEQAMDRAGAKLGNKGAEAALTAVEQARLYREIVSL